jgi:four helix bundle protein
LAEQKQRYSFRSLELWRDAQAFAVDVARLADSLPKTRSADVIARQLIRSSSSIPANIAEGHARYSRAVYSNHLSIAKGSAAESESWLNLLMELGFVPRESGEALERRCISLMGALTRRINALSTQGRGTFREEGVRYETELVPWFDSPMVQSEADAEDCP